jgi:hypothetical protein
MSAARFGKIPQTRVAAVAAAVAVAFKAARPQLNSTIDANDIKVQIIGDQKRMG